MPDPALDDRSLESVIAGVLDAVFALVLELPNSPRARELRTQAQTYERALTGWVTVPPTTLQIAALLHLVTELHGDAAAEMLTPPEVL